MGMSRLLLVVGCLLALSACTSEGDNSGSPSASPPTLTESLPSNGGWADMPAGGPATVPYVHGHRYVTPDDGEEALPSRARGVSGVLAFSDGLLVSDAAYFEGTNGVALVRRGQRVESWPSSGRCSSGVPVASADGRFVAWVTVRCPESEDRSAGAVHRAATDGTHEVTQPIGPGLAQVVGFLGQELVYNLGFQDGAWITDFRDAPSRIPGVDRVASLSERTGLLIGQRGDRARVVVDADGSVRWRVTAGSLVAFSPDGSKVLAVTGKRLSLLRSSDGSTATGFDLPPGVGPWTAVWETNRTLLALMERAGRVAIVRVDLDGHLERVTPAVPVGDGQAPFVLLNPPPTGVRVTVPSHCGVLSVTVDGRLWLAEPPLGGHNPPPGWDENRTSGLWVVTSPGRAEFRGDQGQRASFRQAPEGAKDPNAGCE